MYQLTIKSVRNIPPIASESFDEVVQKATELRDSELGRFVQSVIFAENGKPLFNGSLAAFIEWAAKNAPAQEKPSDFPYTGLKAHARTSGIQGWFSNNHSAVLPAGGFLFAARSLLADSERRVGKQFRRIVVHYDLNGKRQKFDTKDPSVIAKFIGRSATAATTKPATPAATSRLAIEDPKATPGYTLRLVPVSTPGAADVVQVFERLVDLAEFVGSIADTNYGRKYCKAVVTDPHGFQIFSGGLSELLTWASGKVPTAASGASGGPDGRTNPSNAGTDGSEAASGMKARNRAFAKQIKQKPALDLTAALKSQGQRRRQKVAAGK